MAITTNDPSIVHAVAQTFCRQTCSSCGIAFYWPAALDEAARYRARTFWCPGCGQSMIYRETEEQRLRRQLERERERAKFAQDEASRQRDHRWAAERRVSAMKGVVTRTKKRIAAGKCVRCSTEFPDLATHMAKAHPDYTPADETH